MTSTSATSTTTAATTTSSTSTSVTGFVFGQNLHERVAVSVSHLMYLEVEVQMCVRERVYMHVCVRACIINSNCESQDCDRKNFYQNLNALHQGQFLILF
jgi:hypothetical protein